MYTLLHISWQAQEDDNLTEIANHVYGDVLTENPDVARSAFGPHRVVPDRWKGMNADQLEVIKNTQVTPDERSNLKKNQRRKKEREKKERKKKERKKRKKKERKKEKKKEKKGKKKKIKK